MQPSPVANVFFIVTPAKVTVSSSIGPSPSTTIPQSYYESYITSNQRTVGSS